MSIKQEGTVRDYVRLFERMVAQLEGIAEPIMISTFMNGLKPEIRIAVRLLQPRGLYNTIKLAIMIDDDRASGGAEVIKGDLN